MWGPPHIGDHLDSPYAGYLAGSPGTCAPKNAVNMALRTRVHRFFCRTQFASMD